MSESEFFVRAELALDALTHCTMELRKLKANGGTSEQICDKQIHWVYLRSIYLDVTESGYDVTTA
jgi:hypothetical protein